MRCVVKLLLEFESLDDPAARKAFRGVAGKIMESIEDAGTVRELKVIEDRTGRLIDKWDLQEEAAE